MKAPTSIDLSPEAVAQLIVKIQESQIDAQTQLLLLGLIDFCLWLQFMLTESKISISRLKNLFGLATNFKRSSTTQLSFQDMAHPSKIEKCNLCLRNIVLTISQEGHHLSRSDLVILMSCVAS